MNTPKLLAIGSGKGGTSKSTLALALGEVLAAEHGARIALVDADPQAGLSDYAGIAPVAAPLEAEPVEAALAPAPAPKVLFFRGGRALAQASDAAVGAHLARAAEAAGKRGRVIVDLSPAWGDAMHRAVLARPDALLLLAVRLDAGGLTGAAELAKLATARNVPYLIVPTFNKSWVIARTVLSSLRAFHNGRVTSAVIPEDVRAAEAVSARQAVTAYAPKSRAALAIRDLADELAERLRIPGARAPQEA